MALLRGRVFGLAIVLALLLSCCFAAPANNSTKISPPSEALTLTDNDGSSNHGETSTSDDATRIDEVNLCNSSDTEVDCEQTEYSQYMECVEKKRAIRKKRQASCNSPSGASHVDVASADHLTEDLSTLSECQFEQRKCAVGCQGDTTCILGCRSCDDSSAAGAADSSSCPHEYYDCVANCQPGQPCDTTCRSLCPSAVVGAPVAWKTVIFEGRDGDRSDQIQVPIGFGHNITTIIKLNNFINATNHIIVPTNINNTNINTVHLYSNATDGGAFGLGETKDGSCCFAVQPKSCRTSTSGLRCHHRRHKTCGGQCTSRVIHAQSKTTCNRRGECKPHVSYVPQPNPKCHYVAQWPYVACGGQQTQRNCDGCYDHYSSGNGQRSRPGQCLGCYDDGFDVAPRYRKAPFYRPSYYHEPPCYLTGTCYPGYGYGYGYYPQPPPPPPPPMYPMYPPPPPPPYQPNGPRTNGGGPLPDELFPGDDLYAGDDEYSGYEPTDESVFNEAEWDKVVQKCKVINVDENTVIIKNCTEEDLGVNPYAATRISGGGAGDDKEQSAPLRTSPRDAPEYGLDEESTVAAAPYNYQYPPYNYYYNYPPPSAAAYYYGPPGPPPYNYYAAGPAAQQVRSSDDSVDRPYYYDNYGTDDGDDDDQQRAESEDDFWRHDEERDLIEKGFEKVEEKIM